MASTYTLNNGIELIGTGEQSGTWGNTTNTNLELLDTALDGQVEITATDAGSTGSPNSLPITDGSASNGRNRMVIIKSGTDLGGTVYFQLTPNDAEKIIYIRNSLINQDLIVFQGTYSTSNDYLIPNGKTAVIFFDGGGSGAKAANVLSDLQVDALNVETDGSTTEIVIDNTATDGDPILGFALGGTKTFTMGVDDGDGDSFKIGTSAIGTNTRLTINSSGNTTFSGTVTANAGVVVDNITIDGTEIDLSSGDLTIDVEADIILDAKGGDILLKKDTAHWASIFTNGTDTFIQSMVNVGDLYLSGKDSGGSGINALVLDMGNSGAATFNAGATFGNGVAISHSSGESLTLTKTTTEPSLRFEGDSNKDFVLTVSGTTFTLTTNDGATDILVAAHDSRYVGIGTAPDFPLHVSSTGVVFCLNSTSGAVSQRFNENGTARFFINTLDGSNGIKFVNGDGTSERMRIDSNGQIGISGSTTSFDTTGAVNGLQLYYETDSGLATIGSYGGSTGSTALTFHTNSGTSASEEHMRITSSGNVGIGATTVDEMLHLEKSSGTTLVKTEVGGNSTVGFEIKKTGSTTSNWRIADGQTVNGKLEIHDVTDSRTIMTFDGDGNVGIGTISPDNKVNIQESALSGRSASNSNTSLTLEHATDTGIQFFSATQTQLRFGDAASTGAGSIIYTHSDNKMRFSTSALISLDVGGTESLGIDGSGRIGIGNVTPNTNMHAGTFPANLSLGDQGVLLGSADSTQIGHNFYWNGSAFKYKGSGKASRMYQQAGNIVFENTDTSGSTDADLTLSERMRIDSSGNVLIGASASQSVLLSSGNALQIQGLGSNTSGISTTRHSADSGGPYFNFGKSRGTADGAVTVVQSGDILGQIFFSGADGTDIRSSGASIKVEVDGTPSSNDMPGRLVFSTTADGSDTPTERMRIDSNGKIKAQTSGGYFLTENTTDAFSITSNGANGNFDITDEYNSSTRMRIDSSGDVGIGITSFASYGSRLTVSQAGGSSSAMIGCVNTTTSGTRRQIDFFDGSSNTRKGSIETDGTNTSFNTSSDYRLKENVTYTWDATERLKQLKPARFNFIADVNKTIDGFLAHEVSSIIPSAVSGEKDAVDENGNIDPQSIDHSKLVPLLVKTIQELEARIATLEGS